MNAHHPEWSNATSDQRGKNLKEFIQRNNLKVLGDKNIPTHYNAKTKKAGSPDIILCTTNIKGRINKWEVGRDIGSDHLPIIVEMSGAPKRHQNHRNQYWNYNQCNTTEYKKILKDGLSILMDEMKEIQEATRDTINIINDKMVSTILTATEKTCPKIKNKQGKMGNPWWNKECKEAVKERTKRRRTLQKRPNLFSYQQYRTHAKVTKMIIKEAKTQSWNKICREMSLKKAYKLFKAVRESKASPTVIINEDNNKLTDSKEIADAICHFFSNINNKMPRTKPTRKVTYKIDKTKEYSTEISREEIKWAIKEMKIKKAGGPDKIQPFMIIKAEDIVIEPIHKLFNIVWSSGYCPNYWRQGTIIPIPKIESKIIKVSQIRPITLLSVIGKLFEKIITKRLTKISEEKQWIPQFQNGFRRGRSTINNLIILQQEIHAAFKDKKYMATAFLDIKKAYDSVNRDKLFKQLQMKGVGGNMAKWIKSFLLEERSARVKFNGDNSDNRIFKTGVPQGST